ncbi:MAG: putative manganese-dependent inorganic diphosphatase [Opitutales bacterium]
MQNIKKINNMEKTYIVGHKNPDPDSICSAIAYAKLKELQGEPNCVAVRCGNSNARIDKVLSRFSVPLPKFVGDVRLRAGDIMRTKFLKAQKTSSCYEVMDILDTYDIRTLPILNEDNTLSGTISIFDMGEFFIPRPKQAREVRHVKASLADIIATLKGEVLCSFDVEKIEELFVRVGAMEVSTFDSFIERENIPSKQSLIVVGDRYDIQTKAIHMQVRGIVITGGNKVEDYILEMAKAKKVSIFTSPYDSATTSLIIRMATRVDSLIKNDAEIVKKDFLLSKINMGKEEFFSRMFCVCNDDNTVAGIFSSADLIKLKKTKLILVDHNEYSQAVNGASEAEIVEIIDHHRIGSLSSVSPIFVMNKPVGATCTIVSEMFRKSGFSPDEKTAGVLLSGIICDTLNLNSPTTTDCDRAEVAWLEGILNITADELADYIFKSDSVFLTSTPDEVVDMDCKIYEHNEYKFSVAQVEDLGFDNFYKRLPEMKEALEKYREKNDLFFSCMLLTNVNTQDSILLVAGASDLIAKIGYARDGITGIFDMPNIVSRKKQLIPYFSNILESL